MSDYSPDDFTGYGYYKITYGRDLPPDGPFDSIRAMADTLDLSEYPGDGYVVWYDADGVSSVPSLNPDDLVPEV